MADSIDSNGLQVKTANEITSDLKTGFKTIYGADINLDSNTPDGQLVGIMAQIAVDLRELLVAINNSFDPDQAQGVLLDQRCAINNVVRQGGTYTVQPIDVTVSTTTTLSGLSLIHI